MIKLNVGLKSNIGRIMIPRELLMEQFWAAFVLNHKLVEEADLKLRSRAGARVRFVSAGPGSSHSL